MDLLRHYARLLLPLLAALLALPALAQDVKRLGPGISYERIATYDRARLDRIVGPELDDFMHSSTLPSHFRGRFPAASNDVDLYRVTYASLVPEWDNKPTIASGLIAAPRIGRNKAPVVSYQHGTVFDRSFVPSQPENSYETRIMISRFASQGYIVVAADYFGRGSSDLPDSYLVKRSTQQAAYDMLQAARAVFADLKIEPENLFVSGWSQGGWATMAFLQKLESAGEKVTAAAAASAPVDIRMTISRWVNNRQSVDAVYLPGVIALNLGARENYYRIPGLTESSVRPEYVQAARSLYKGEISFDDFFAQTPPTLQQFLRPEFIASADNALAPHWQALDADEAYRWRRVTPVTTWYGGHDEVTPAFIGRLPELTQDLLGGARTRAVDAGPQADHRGVFLQAVLDQKGWFDSFLAK